MYLIEIRDKTKCIKHKKIKKTQKKVREINKIRPYDRKRTITTKRVHGLGQGDYGKKS